MKINKCIYCGSIPEVKEEDGLGIMNVVVECQCGNYSKYWATEEDAIKHWNELN